MTEYAVCYDSVAEKYHVIAKDINDKGWHVKLSCEKEHVAEEICDAFEAKEREFQCANCEGHIFVADIDAEYGVIYSHEEDTGCDDPEIEGES